MNSEDTRNLFLAIALSVLVMAAWQYFYAGPLYQREHQAQLQANNSVPKSEAQSPAAPGAPRSRRPLCRPARPPQRRPPRRSVRFWRASPRVAIDTPSLGGSIDLKGGKIDDIVLKDYRETIDPKSPLIRLFSPPGAPDAYWAETGFVSAGGAKTPNLDTVWTADAKTLTSERPVTLTWDNGAGLVFKRVIAVDDKYMFTITDSVVNSGAAPATLQPFALILRHGRPNVAGYSVLHEGFVGVITSSGASQVGLTLPVQKSPTRRSKRTPAGCGAFKGDGGWLGFTDKYWGSAVIPEQTAPIDARFTASGTVQPVDYQADFLGKEQTVAPGAAFETTTRVFAGAKEVSTLDNYESNLGIKKFYLMIDWGWFWLITIPMFRLHRRHLQGRRQFRRRDPHRHRPRQARLLPARQSLLPVDGEDEEDPAADRRAEGALS